MMCPDDLSPVPDGPDATDAPTASLAMQGQADLYRREAVETFRAIELVARDVAAAFDASDGPAAINALAVYHRLQNHAGGLLTCLSHLGSSAGTA